MFWERKTFKWKNIRLKNKNFVTERSKFLKERLEYLNKNDDAGFIKSFNNDYLDQVNEF
jgi:hypothetical protein